MNIEIRKIALAAASLAKHQHAVVGHRGQSEENLAAALGRKLSVKERAALGLCVAYGAECPEIRDALWSLGGPRGDHWITFRELHLFLTVGTVPALCATRRLCTASQ